MIRARSAAWLALLCIVFTVYGGIPASSAQDAAETADARTRARNMLQKCGVKGGLVVHVGCDDGELTTALKLDEGFTVQGLADSADDVRAARARVDAEGLYGEVSVQRWDGKNLPYANNLVNMLVVESSALPEEEMMRALSPGGCAYIKDENGWTKKVKPRPAEMDEWTHYLHGPDNNAVGQDSVVGPPRHLQWVGRPRFSRSHDHLASVTALVSAGRRIFYIVDEGSTAFAAASPDWRLVARDAFSGVILWKRKISPWEYHLRDFRSGPAALARRLVAAGDEVYVTLGYGKPVSVLDAASGETIRTCENTEGAQEIIRQDGDLLVVLGDRKTDWRAEKAKEIVSKGDYRPPFDKYNPPVHNKRVAAVDPNTGETLWKKSEPYTSTLMPTTLAATEDRVFFQNAGAVVCLDRESGNLYWRADRPTQRRRLAWSTPTLVVRDGIVYSADRRAEDTDGDLFWLPSGGFHSYIRGKSRKGKLIAFDAETGERFWSCPAYEGFNAPVDVLFAGGLLWSGNIAWGGDPGFTKARDPWTGEVVRTRPRDQKSMPGMGHSRCHRSRATEEFLILGRRGIEFLDVETGDILANRWVRGICQYGVMPANGMLYVPPHSCACSVDDMLKHGFMALAPRRHPTPDPGTSLDPGPAEGFSQESDAGDYSPAAAWPTYRHDMQRSGSTPAVVPADLEKTWQAEVGQSLTSPVVAGGRVVVAETDAHRVHAFDAESGETVWRFRPRARIDSAPTIHRGRVLFGSADGRVYCLRLRDGKRIWTFRAAPTNRQIIDRNQLESRWPIPGNILVLDGAAYFPAGRNSYLDGGMALYKIDAKTGRKMNVVSLKVDEKKRNSGRGGGCLPDLLSSDGESIFMRTSRFGPDLEEKKRNVPHLFSSAGLRNGDWWHRTYWQLGTRMGTGWGGWPKAGRKVPAGRLLVYDGRRVFGYGRNQYSIAGAHVGVDGRHVWGPLKEPWTYYRLFGRRMDKRSPLAARRTAPESESSGPDWSRRLPVLARTMLLADDTLFIAGPPNPADDVPKSPPETDPMAAALQGERGGTLLVVSASSGDIMSRTDLGSPAVFDGMAAVSGHLYVCTTDGRLTCLSGTR